MSTASPIDLIGHSSQKPRAHQRSSRSPSRNSHPLPLLSVPPPPTTQRAAAEPAPQAEDHDGPRNVRARPSRDPRRDADIRVRDRPGQEGPSFGPPSLPEGWIAQWDGMGRKYYFVQLSTGASQWETPTQAAPTGPTPNATPQGIEHPYGTPAQQDQGELITNPDGSRSVRMPDGSVQLVGADGERSLGVSSVYFVCRRGDAC
jgi:hypothetical protein